MFVISAEGAVTIDPEHSWDDSSLLGGCTVAVLSGVHNKFCFPFNESPSRQCQRIRNITLNNNNNNSLSTSLGSSNLFPSSATPMNLLKNNVGIGLVLGFFNGMEL